MMCFLDINKQISKFTESQRTRITKMILKEKNEVGGQTLSYFKTHFRKQDKLAVTKEQTDIAMKVRRACGNRSA